MGKPLRHRNWDMDERRNRRDKLGRGEDPSSAPTPVPPAPCPAPEGAWIDEGLSNERFEAAHALDDYVLSRPHKFSGIWSAAAVGAVQVPVIGTVEDVDSVTRELADIYPFQLCVVPVEFSERDLRYAASSIEALEEGWSVDIDPVLNRVVVSPPVYDREAAVTLDRYRDRTVINPVVELAR